MKIFFDGAKSFLSSLVNSTTLEKWVTGMHKERTLIDSTSPSVTLECGKCIQYDRMVSHFDDICYWVKGWVVDVKKGGRNRTLEKATTGLICFPFTEAGSKQTHALNYSAINNKRNPIWYLNLSLFYKNDWLYLSLERTITINLETIPPREVKWL